MQYAVVDLSVSPTITVGQYEPSERRITEEGEVRRTQANVTRITEESQIIGGTVDRLRPVSAVLETTPVFVEVFTSKASPVSLGLQATPAITVSPQRRRYAALDMTAQPLVAEVFTTKIGPVSAGMTAQTAVSVFTAKTAPVVLDLTAHTVMTAGRDEPLIRRITEAGDLRRTQSGNVRIVEENPEGGNIIVVQPAYRIYVKWDGVWRVLAPHVKHDGQWKMPTKIYPKDGGLWLPVRSHL